MGLLFIDINRFKQVIDTYGHFTGDLVLREVARRLARCTRPPTQSDSWDTNFQLAGNVTRETIQAAFTDLLGRDPDFDPAQHVHVGDVTDGDTRTT